MEHRQDYLESQMDIISKMLRRLLQKLRLIEPGEEMESEMQSIISGPVIANSETLTLDKLKNIEDTLLIRTLVEEYGYSIENLKLLADILFELARKSNDNSSLRNKTLTLYRHYLSGTNKSIDFLVFSRVQELAREQA